MAEGSQKESYDRSYSAIKPARSQLRHEEKELRRYQGGPAETCTGFSAISCFGTRWLDARSRRPRGGVNFIDCHTNEFLGLAKSVDECGWVAFVIPSLRRP